MHACSAGIARMGVPALERSLHARRGRARARGCARRLRRCSRCARGVRTCAARAPSRRPPRLRTPDGGGENTYVKGVWEALLKSADAVRNMAGKLMAAMEAASASRSTAAWFRSLLESHRGGAAGSRGRAG